MAYGKRRRKDPAAAKLGRKGGRARARKLTAERLTEIGQFGAAIRWGKRKPSEARSDE